MNSPQSFTLEDARRAMIAVLSDPDFNTLPPHPAILTMVEAALQSPRTLLYLLKGREGAALPAEPWRKLIERCLRVTVGHPDRPALVDYLTNHPGLPAFDRSLLAGNPSIQFSDSQGRALDRLEGMARLYFSQSFAGRRIQPRLIPLLAGPSGAGKSWLVRTFAEKNGWPFCRLTYGNWRPRGARSQPDTYTELADFLNRHEEAVIQLDEIDKAGDFANGEWTAAILLEILAVLDRILYEGAAEGTPLAVARTRLQRSVFLVATGTWQSVWTGAAAKVIGFGATPGPVDGRIRKTNAIPEELLNRLNGDILFIAPPSEAELRRMAEADGLVAQAAALGVQIDFQAGAATGLGMRWLESMAADLALKAESCAPALPSLESETPERTGASPPRSTTCSSPRTK